ncbi:hypothetical protein ANRL1_03859 [Anaerolineae bacterium]|nr:hypothetical protein ANRL1_03859 [Anaerolineae bacterium]
MNDPRPDDLCTDDMLILTVSVYRVLFQHEIGRTHPLDFTEHIVARSFSDAVEIAEALSEELETPIGLIENLGAIYVTAEAQAYIACN